MALDGFGCDTTLQLLFLGQVASHIIHNEIVQCVASKSFVPSCSKYLDFLNSLVKSANILHRTTLETQNTGRSRSSPHIVNNMNLWLVTLRNTRERTASRVVQTNCETIADKCVNIQASQLSCQLETPLFLRGVERRISDHSVSDVRSCTGKVFGIGLDLLQLHSQKLLNQERILLLRLAESVASKANGAPLTRSGFQPQGGISVLVGSDRFILHVVRNT